MTDKEKNCGRIFLIFLVLHVLVWSVLPFIRDLLPVDALETIVWGGYFDFGTHKHPPMAGYLAYLFYNLLGKTDFSIYLLGQTCICGGFIYLYKLGLYFLNKIQSILAVMIMEGCFCYSYMTVFDGFNPNFLLLLFFPAIAYYFYKSMEENRLKDWILLGLCVGLSFLSKYQTILLIIPMLLYVLILPKGREQFKCGGAYLSAAIAALVFLPHFIWMYQQDFFPLMYFQERAAHYSQSYLGWIKYFKSPFMFLLSQLLAILGSLLIFLMLHLRFKLPWKLREDRNISDTWFLIFLGLAPVLLQALPGVITGSRIHSTWGYPMVYMTGILLFYFFPIKISDKVFSYAIKWAYAAMAITFIALLILFSVEKNYRSRYPVEKIATDMKTVYLNQTQKPLKYIGGYIEYNLPITIYDKTHPQIIFDTYGHKNPWVNLDDVKKSGLLIIDGDYENAKNEARRFAPYLPENYNLEPQKYDFKIYNKFKKERTYEIFYLIVPPMN